MLQSGRKRSLASFMVAALWAAVLVAPVAAEEDGRYRAIVMQEGGRAGPSGGLHPRVFIIDSREGHLWTWEQDVRLEGTGSGPSFGTAIIYQGHLRPGQKIGEIVSQGTR